MNADLPLTGPQLQVLQALLSGHTAASAAQAFQLSERTVRSWTALPPFRNLLLEGQAQLIAETGTLLAVAAAEAVRTLVQVCGDPLAPERFDWRPRHPFLRWPEPEYFHSPFPTPRLLPRQTSSLPRWTIRRRAAGSGRIRQRRAKPQNKPPPPVRASPSAFRLPPSAFRLPPSAFILHPSTFRVRRGKIRQIPLPIVPPGVILPT
jgi:hypothetical protein